ncbi:MAG TPA: adenosylcobinamide-GDP ribazoletransferase [Actinocrinis sp.]|nr:adenosylcobinamide-GDP ribazoletransferase [Actinocrinis sp.]
MSPAGPGPGLQLAVTTLSVLRLPVRPAEAADPAAAGAAMTAAPLVGLLLGAVAAAVGGVARWYSGSPALAAVAAVAVLAALTRALHLDGLADTADGLGSGKPAEAALDIMKRSDIGPFGVVTLLLTLAMQITALTIAYERAGSAVFGRGAAAVLVAAMAGRLAITAACTPRIRSARPGGLGAWVSGSVSQGAAIAMAVLCVAVAAGLGLLVDAHTALLAAVSVPVALLAAGLLLRRCVRRFGGITGDVLGALTETGTTTALLVFAAR